MPPPRSPTHPSAPPVSPTPHPRPPSPPLAPSEDIFKEIDILCGLNHDNIVGLKEYFEEGNKVGEGGGEGTAHA